MPRKNTKKKAVKPVTVDEATQQSINRLIAKAEDKLIESDADAALTILNEALQLNPANATVLYCLAEACQMLGNVSEALEYLQASCAAEPESHPHRYLALAQMLYGEDALQAVKTGIKLLERDLALAEKADDTMNSDSTQSVDEMKHMLAAAYVAASELYTTDCCDREDAESECERSIARALELRPDSLEAHHAQGNLRCIVGKFDEAKESLATCMDIIRNDPGLGSMSAMSLVDNETEDVDESDHVDDDVDQSVDQAEEKTNDISEDDNDDEHDQTVNPPISDHLINQLADSPTYEVRLNVAKLAFELQEYEDALFVLRRLSQEDDRIIEVQHLYACSLLLTNRVRQALRRAYIALHMVEQTLLNGSSDDQSMDDEAEVDTEALKGAKKALQSVISDCRKEIQAVPSLVSKEMEANPSLKVAQVVEQLCELAKKVAVDPSAVASDDEDDDDDWLENDDEDDADEDLDDEDQSDDEQRMEADE